MILDGLDINHMLNCNQKIIILGHNYPDVDSIVSGYLLERCLVKEGYDAKFYILDKEINKETSEILNKYNFDVSYYQNNYIEDKNNVYFLVDHNETTVNGNIVGIIDHHPTNKKIEVECYFNKPISSTALYICKENENLLSTLKELQNDNRNLSFKLKVTTIIAAVMSFLTGIFIGLE